MCVTVVKKKKKKKGLAEDGFDPSTSGLWAQHAPTAPLCFLSASRLFSCLYSERLLHSTNPSTTQPVCRERTLCSGKGDVFAVESEDT